jgi:hypothetical protein
VEQRITQAYVAPAPIPDIPVPGMPPRSIYLEPWPNEAQLGAGARFFERDAEHGSSLPSAPDRTQQPARRRVSRDGRIEHA